MCSIVFVARPLAADIGPGGRHRTYQIAHDLVTGFGADRVHTLSLSDWHARHGRGGDHPTSGPSLPQRIARRIVECRDNPLAVFHGTGYSSHTFAPRGFVADFRALLARLPRPAVTVIDDPRFTGIVEAARVAGVPVIACTQNLESLDLAAADPHGTWGLRTHVVDLANEIGLLARCAARMFISQVETAMARGLGIEAEHYPYLPVGAIRHRLKAIRLARLHAARDRSLVVALGSAMHGTTRRAFEWFLAHARHDGLPPGMRLVLAGMGTETLDLRGTVGVEARGWVDQPELDELLVAARAVIVPQFTGFGAVTRLAELSCAGVPTLAAPHALRAVDPPPGVQAVGESWPEWRAALASLLRDPGGDTWDYPAWETAQPRPLHRTISRWLQEA